MQCYIRSFFSVSHSLVCFLIPLLYLGSVLDIFFIYKIIHILAIMKILIWTDWTQSKNTLSYTLFVPKLSSTPVMLIIS